MGLARHDGEDVGDFGFGLGGGGVAAVVGGAGEDLLDAWRGWVCLGGCWGCGDFEGLGGGFLVDEDGEAGVEELGEDVSERG